MFVCIYASSVAQCIGANKHKKMNEAMESLWNRVAPASFAAAMKRNGMKTEDEIAKDIIEAHGDVRDLVDLTLKEASYESSDQVAKQYSAVAEGLRAVNLAEHERRRVDDVVRRTLYTTYGNLHERPVLTYVQQNLGIKCVEDPTFYKLKQGVCSGPWGSFSWFVGGKIDAISEDRTQLIEIKNRVNKLYYRVPFYEVIQVQTYLHVLNIEKGLVVECHKMHRSGGETSARAKTSAHPSPDPVQMSVNVLEVNRDVDLWERVVVPKLEGFVDFFARLLHDRSLQDRYMQSSRRSSMISSHINAWLKFRPH